MKNNDTIGIKCLPTNQFVNLILSRTGVIHSFKMVNDWFDIVYTIVLEPQTVLICESNLFSRNSTICSLPSYQNSDYRDGIPAKQSDECLRELIQGLEKFKLANNYFEDVWHVKERAEYEQD